MIACLISILIVLLFLLVFEQIVEWGLVWVGLATQPPIINILRLIFVLVFLLYAFSCLLGWGGWTPIRLR